MGRPAVLDASDAGSPDRYVGERLRSLIARFANVRWPVLILGETGTGKEVVARSIHERNPIGPFVTIDCSAMVGTIIESELFGHAKGAFTGAVVSKIGLIEAANGGTAFLDEIAELPLDLQAKLLRVLQEKEYRPVGSLQPRYSDFRVIAATNRDLAKEVERGAFRRDLYYRLNVVSVSLPPLRDRREEIPGLASHFLAKYGRGHRLAIETLNAMLAYDWPGNVRELENAIQRMVAMHDGPLLHCRDLPENIFEHTIHKRREAVAVAVGGVMRAPPSRQMDTYETPVIPLTELERREIVRALMYTRNDRGLAATLLGLGRSTLYRKIKEYGIAAEDLQEPPRRRPLPRVIVDWDGSSYDESDS